jgi:hypothetical protein
MRILALHVLATLLGLFSALSAAATVVFAAFWLLDQGPTAGLPSLVVAIVLGVLALAAMLGRRVLIVAAGRLRTSGGVPT